MVASRSDNVVFSLAGSCCSRFARADPWRRGVLVVPVAGGVVMIPPYVDTLAICASIGLAGRGLSMISMRSDITAAS